MDHNILIQSFNKNDHVVCIQLRVILYLNGVICSLLERNLTTDPSLNRMKAGRLEVASG